MGYKIYAPNEDHTCDYGVDFFFGAGFTEDLAAADLFEAKGYTVVENAAALSEFDKLPTAVLKAFAEEFEVTLEEDATKKEIVDALIAAVGAAALDSLATALGLDPAGLTRDEVIEGVEGQLEKIAIEITGFTAIEALDGGTAAEPAFADVDAVIAALPEKVYCDAGTIPVPVEAWVDTDTYNAAAEGSYTFTATLGALPPPYANTAAVTATVEVVIAAAEE